MKMLSEQTKELLGLIHGPPNAFIWQCLSR